MLFRGWSQLNARAFSYLSRSINSFSKKSDPLRILFCGADQFSIASLKALHAEHVASSDFIKSIDVLCKSDKKSGRGLKTYRSVPIASVAKELSLPLQQIEAFSEFEWPTAGGDKINLVVAVSFGLLIPQHVIQGAKYGGLNVHPSLLPDFRGAAPVHHVLLSRCTHTGISLQTLHPQRFDRGAVLLQTPKPGITIPRPDAITVPQLSALLAPFGAELLVQGLRERLYINPKPLEDIHTLRRPAPKITPDDRHIKWHHWTADEILLRHRVVGPLWCTGIASGTAEARGKRIVWPSGFKKEVIDLPTSLRPGMAMIRESDSKAYFRTVEGHVISAASATVEGKAENSAYNALRGARCFDNYSENSNGQNYQEGQWIVYSHFC